MAMMVSAPQLRGEGHSRPRNVASRTLTRRGAKARKTMTVSTLDMERLFMLQYTSRFSAWLKTHQSDQVNGKIFNLLRGD